MPPRRPALFLLAVSAAFPLLADSGGSPALPDGYAGQEACAPCHGQINDSFQKLGMGRSWSTPPTAEIIEDYSKGNTFYHEKSGFYYTMLERGGKFFQRRYVLSADKKPIHVHEEEVTYIVGSGNHARTYLHHHPNGVITQLPVTWYNQAKRWGMSPGYDIRDHADFTRAIPHGCVFCHTAYPRLAPDRVEDINYFPHRVPSGIGCERCHGPGETHVRFASQGQPGEMLRRAIYNPGRDTKQAQRTICYQCHVEISVDSVATRVIKPDRDMFSYRPGQQFSEYAIQFLLQGEANKGFQVVQHADLMEASRCFQASRGQMTCTSCHDPHRKDPPKEAAASYRKRCQACHQSEKLSRHTPAQLAGDCVACHMPRGVPTNASHTVFTNHRVGIYPKTGSVQTRSTAAITPQLVFRGTSERLPEYEKVFFLGTAYLDAPTAELAGRPDLAKKGIHLMQDYVSRVTRQGVSPAYLSRAEALLGKGYQVLKEPEKALEHYEKSVELREGQFQTLYDLALLYANNRDLLRSEQYFSKVLQRFPDHVPSIHGLGALAEAAGRQTEAIQHFVKAVNLFPGALSSHYRLAQIYLSQQRTKEAIEELQKCLSLNPKYLPAYMDLGHILAIQNKPSEARQLFEQALKLDDSKEEVYNAISVVADQQGSLEGSLKALQRAVARGIASEMTFMNLGNIYARKENCRQAVQFFELARKKNPGNPKVLFALGLCHLKTGEIAKGRSFLEQVIQLDPQNLEAIQALKQLRGR